MALKFPWRRSIKEQLDEHRCHDEAVIRKYLLGVMATTQGCHATHLEIGGDDRQLPSDGAPVRCRVGEEWYDCPPFPLRIRPGVLAVLLQMAKVPADGAFPKEGAIEEDSEGTCLRWRLRVQDEHSPCVLCAIST